MNIDWRSRAGVNCVTSVRDQLQSANCWAFAATALVESMIRIEHSIWAVKSEGDVRNGVGKNANDFGNMGEVSPFLSNHGLADPDCFAWGTDHAIYESDNAKFLSSPQTPIFPISPTSDRSGRVARLGHIEAVTGEAAQMQWIERIGPLVAVFEPYTDFGGYSPGIYSHSSSATPGGAMHYMLIVGFNDDEPMNKYWIAKNSYGAAWGENGFINIKFGEGGIGTPEMYGIRNTDPSPWSKRRYRNGGMIEGNGTRHINFELFMVRNGNLEWWHCQDRTSVGIWELKDKVETGRFIEMPAVVHSTYNRNYEIIVPNNTGQLEHHYFSHFDGKFHHTKTFGTGVAGIAGFIQSNESAPGDFQVVVRLNNGTLKHWIRHNAAPWKYPPNTWYDGPVFGTDIKHTGPALIQAHPTSQNYRDYRIEAGRGGDYHLVCVDNSGQMQHWVNNSTGWALTNNFGSNIDSAPCMIEGIINCPDEVSIGDFELCVVNTNGQVEYWRFHPATNQWTLSATFGANIKRVLSLMLTSREFELSVIVERADGHIEQFRGGTSRLPWRSIGVIV